MSFRLQWPTQYGIITQEFRQRPEFYRKFGLPGHEGIDFQGPEGTELYAVADGVISDIRLDGNANPLQKPYGNQVRIQHQDGQYESIYAHLIQVAVTVGQQVKANQLIGLSGNTGNSFGAHLHLTLKKKDATQSGETDFPYDIVDPTPYLEPFPGSNRQAVQPTPPEQASLHVQVASEAGFLNMRNVPDVNGALITQLPDGTLLGALEPADIAQRKIGQQGQWLWVRAPDGQVGYVAAWYVCMAGGATPGDAAVSVVVESPDDPLKVRSGPGVGNAELTRVPHGAVLTAMETEHDVRRKIGVYGEWLHIQTPDGVTGYTAAWYVRLYVPGLSFGISDEPEERSLMTPDDLTRIAGIDSKTASLLNTIGIGVFEQFAALTLEQLQTILAEAGIQARHMSTWAEQARLLSEGRLDELDALQKTLPQP